MDLIKKYLPILLIIFIFGQSMPFKFGIVDSVTTDHIFTSTGEFLGLPIFKTYGGVITGLFEIVAIIMLIIPATRGFGGLLALGLMTAAIGLHLTAIGISVPVEVPCTEVGLVNNAVDGIGAACTEDDPTLFAMAIIAWISALVVTLGHKGQLMSARPGR